MTLPQRVIPSGAKAELRGLRSAFARAFSQARPCALVARRESRDCGMQISLLPAGVGQCLLHRRSQGEELLNFGDLQRGEQAIVGADDDQLAA